MKKYITDIAALFIIFFAISIFFCRLFWPTPSLIVTPDFGRSDAWHFSFGQKYALWQALQNRELPLWNKNIGAGFPLIAEGQIGAFFLPNLLFFSLPDPVFGYNTALVLSIVTLAFGMYWCCRIYSLSAFASVFGALTLAFSALPVLHLTHISLLQGMSMLPLLVAIATKITRHSSFIWIALFAFAGAQQLFAGFPQASFLTIGLCTSFVLYISWRSRDVRLLGRYLLAIVLLIGLSSVQLLPSLEFLRQSTHPTGFNADTAMLYSFPLKHLLTFVAPFALGNPKVGSYPPFYEFDGSIFWENNGYLGIVPLVFVWFAPYRKFFVVAALLSFLLAWGKYSPLYFLYSFWPLTLFRVPSRFLWILVFILVFFSAHGVSHILRTYKNRILTYVIFLSAFGNIILLAGLWWSYHLIVPAATWISPPESAGWVTGRVKTIGSSQVHNSIFISKGWEQAELYYFLREGIDPESNLVWNISQHDVLSGRSLRRSSLTEALTTQSMMVSEKHATFSSQTRMYLNMFSVETILSMIPLSETGLILKRDIQKDGLMLQIFDNPTFVPRFHMVYEATRAATLTQAYTILQEQTFNPAATVLLEDHTVETNPLLLRFISEKQSIVGQGSADVSIIADDHEHVRIDIQDNPVDGLLVVADTNYPGWIARIDNNETPIFTANLSQRAIIVPSGSHTVTFDYKPKSILYGGITSILFLAITILGAVAQIVVSGIHTGKKAPVHGLGRPRNRDK